MPKKCVQMLVVFYVIALRFADDVETYCCASFYVVLCKDVKTRCKINIIQNHRTKSIHKVIKEQINKYRSNKYVSNEYISNKKSYTILNLGIKIMSKTQFVGSQSNMLRQPEVFSLAVLISAFERFGFYILADSLLLYLEHFFGFSDHDANLLYSALNTLVYSAPVIGGYLADNVLGIRRSIVIGLILEGLGQACLIVSQPLFMYIGIAFVITGVGFFKTSPTNLLARSYNQDDSRIDSGYTFFYMAMNIGSAVSAILAGFLQRYFGWSIIFLIASIGTYLGLVAYSILRFKAQKLDVNVGYKKLSWQKITSVICGILVAVGAITFLVSRPEIARLVFYVIAFGALAYCFYEIRRGNPEERKKIIACLLLIFIGMIFFMMYFQRYTSVLLFIDRSVRHTVFGYDIPSIAMLALNPLWIIILSPLLVSVYRYFLKTKGKDIVITSKFATGLLIISLSFFVLKISTFFADANQQVSMGWIIAAFGLYSLGELLVSSLGVAMVARLAPKRMYGILMGAWFLIATSIGSLLGGVTANMAALPKNLTDAVAMLHIYGHVFVYVGCIGLGITLLAFIANPYIKKIAGL